MFHILKLLRTTAQSLKSKPLSGFAFWHYDENFNAILKTLTRKQLKLYCCYFQGLYN